MHLSLHWHGAKGIYTVKKKKKVMLACEKKQKKPQKNIVGAVCITF